MTVIVVAQDIFRWVPTVTPPTFPHKNGMEAPQPKDTISNSWFIPITGKTSPEVRNSQRQYTPR